MQRFLAHSFKFRCNFKVYTGSLCTQLLKLSSHIVDHEEDGTDSALQQLLYNKLLTKYNKTTILQIMTVFIDGACATVSGGQRQGSWGILEA